jgi:hypothetical protein
MLNTTTARVRKRNVNLMKEDCGSEFRVWSTRFSGTSKAGFFGVSNRREDLRDA